MDIVFVGAGRLATNLASALKQKGHRIVAVWSRTIGSAQTLATMVDTFTPKMERPQQRITMAATYFMRLEMIERMERIL